MELTQLKYFYAVAKNLHVTKTAEQLHIAQPALTQAVRRLEKELGHPLFASKGRNIVLTEYGKYLKEQYSLPDHRNDSAYAKWNEALDRYKKAVGQA